jgi:two-component SAPR family response regulator
VILITDMNKKEKHDLELILYRLNEQDKSVGKLEKHFNSKFNEIHEDISFIKENLFNPETGLWAETKQNSAFRKNTTMWRGIIGGGVIAALVESFWGMFTN